MTDLLRALCTYDSRHPDYESLYWDEDPKPTPQPNCFCDNCFYGRTELANEIIRLRSTANEGGSRNSDNIPTDVSVSERLPGPKDCNEEGV